MERVAVADVRPTDLGSDGRRWRLADVLGADAVAINRFEVPPGGGLPGGLHAHADQEEVFVVRSGEATFETFRGVVRVTAGEAIRFAPGEFQSGRNDGESALVVLAIGAPLESDDTRVPIACPELRSTRPPAVLRRPADVRLSRLWRRLRPGAVSRLW